MSAFYMSEHIYFARVGLTRSPSSLLPYFRVSLYLLRYRSLRLQTKLTVSPPLSLGRG